MKISKRIFLVIVTCLFLIVVVGVGSTLTTEEKLATIINTQNLSAGEIFAKANMAVQQYKYAQLKLNIVEGVDDTENHYQYIVSSERDKVYQCIEYYDFQKEEMQSNIWYRDTDGSFVVYTYDNNYEIWVRGNSDELPATFEMWDMLANTDMYTLLDETSNTEEYGECYVFEVITSTPEFSTVVESVLINCETFLPVAIITDGINETKSEVVTNTDGGVQTDTTVQYYDETLVRYVFQYSNEPFHFYDEPEKYLTYEEYANLISEEETSSE